MKKITLLTAFLMSFAGYCQTNKQIIQTYLDSNRAKSELTSQDVSDWAIESEVPGSGTKITSTYIVQRYQGIEIFNAQSLAAVKDGKVISLGNNFKSNIAGKVNTTTPSLTVIQAIASAYSKLAITNLSSFSIIETINDKKFKLTDGLQEDPINAKLVFQPTADNKLRLAWYFQFYSPDGQHLWDLRIDALNGSILEKNDLTVHCNFGDASHKNEYARKNFSFENALVKKNTSAVAVVIPGSYRVIPYNCQDPAHSPSFQLITTAGNALASPNGWHDANAIGGTTAALKYTYTRGNNVLAQEDRDHNDGTGIRPDGTASLTFDFPYGGVTAQTSSYTPAATTNLFYMTNVMHDVWYQYGFTEAAHNFQQNNLGRGGTTTATGDAVQADAQDGAALVANYTAGAGQNRDNSNFATPADGTRPRLQSYIWDNYNVPIYNFLNVISPASIAGGYASKDNSFDTTDHIAIPEAPNGIVADIVLFNNDPTPPGYHSACQAATNPFELSGKIALIERGSCLFSAKVKRAQDAGALAVILMDSIPQSATYTGTIGMTSTGVLGITIPAISVNNDVGNALIAELANGPVNGKIESPGNLYVGTDGDFDNTILGHEYGHGISGRLIGGGTANCMTNAEQMGEGWSDWFGLMMQLKTGDTGADAKGVGTYEINEPITGTGIRAYPYSTDMTINPLTLVDSNVAEVHSLGEPWAVTLWDLTWAYIAKYGYDPDIYNGTGGNNKVMRLVLDALKLQACGTASFISARDNLIAADQATTGGHDYCLITDVFTRRGMGLNASSGDANVATDQTEDFTPFPAGPNCTFLAVDYFQNEELIRVFPNPANGTINLRINKFIGKVNIQFVDINGRVIKNINDDDFNIQKSIDVSSLQTGMYIIKVSGDQINYTQKVMIN